MQSSKEFVRPLQSRTPGKAYPAARLYILIMMILMIIMKVMIILMIGFGYANYYATKI